MDYLLGAALGYIVGQLFTQWRMNHYIWRKANPDGELPSRRYWAHKGMVVVFKEAEIIWGAKGPQVREGVEQ